MARSPSFVLNIQEPEGDPSQDPSPCDESGLQSSFHQLIEEQSQQAEALELQERLLGDPDNGQGPGPPEYSSATLQILASMPSRTIGRSRGAIISQYYNRTVKLRRRNTRPALRDVAGSARPTIRQYHLDLEPTTREEEEEKQSLLVKELQALPVGQRYHTLRSMPLSLAEKRRLWQDSCDWTGRPSRGRRGQEFLPCCSYLKYHCIIALRGLWYRLLSGLHALQPWHNALKQISGQFGSSVLSYFLFLKTLLTFNALLLFFFLTFIVALQAAFPPPQEAARRPAFVGLELLTGAGYFTHTVMYYGYYSNFTLNQPCSSTANASHCPPGEVSLPYNMPLAYLLTTGVAFFVTCIVLVYSMSHSFGESYRVGSTLGAHAVAVFCSWDYKVTDLRGIRLQQDNLRTQLKELVADWQLRRHPLGWWRRLCQLARVVLVWMLCLSVAVGFAIAVYYFSEYLHQSDRPVASGSGPWEQEAKLLVLPLVVGLINLLVPYLYMLLTTWELHDSPGLEVYMAICRNLILKMVILGLLCFHWLSRKVRALQDQCWETFVGQELYRFVVMDFIFTLLDTLFGELVWRLISEKREGKRKPEFDIGRNVLELIYGQTLTWLGVLFSPLLPAVQIIKLLLLFWVKKASLMANCQAPGKPWQASHMSTVFITLLCFPSFLGAAIFLSYAIWSVRPSGTCGPFRNLDTMYEAGKTWVRRLEGAGPHVSWFVWIHQYLVENTFFLFVLSALLLTVIYLNIQVVKGQRRVIRRLKEQISNEGEDKEFLISKLHAIYGRRDPSL
ncbi:transmembrane channel-like protein 6 [Tachyglossus aculeatus]|uniref:transmembrane channel-like protein 6 n=1 Tax=Tachyglossus aculeatus TaxID=9261 RepID=UPI0018F649E4|nr:transmembrane channel-like protein 6 [Tachyglossus aculeatus]